MLKLMLLPMALAIAFAGCQKDQSWRFDRAALQGQLRLVTFSIKKDGHRWFDFSRTELLKLENEMGGGYISFQDGATDFDFVCSGEFVFSDGYSFKTRIWGGSSQNKFIITYLLPGEMNAMSDISQYIDLSQVLSKDRIQQLFTQNENKRTR